MGDPELNIWTNIPQYLIVDIPNILYTDQMTHFDINVSDFNLSITKDNEIYINTTSETFNGPHNSGTYHLVVTSENYIPYETTITFEESLNNPPIITTATLPSATEGILYEVLIGVEDPDIEETHTFELIAGPSWLSIGSETGMLTGIPGKGDVTTEETINIRVTDSGGLTGERSYTIGVAALLIEPPGNVQVLDMPNDNGHQLKLTWTASPSESEGKVDWYRIYRSRSDVLTDPILISDITSIEEFKTLELNTTILIATIDATGENEYNYIDTWIPVNGVSYYYWLQAVWHYGESRKVAAGGMTFVVENVPSEFQVSAPYPNPFNPTTTFLYKTPEDCYVQFVIYDILGREIAILQDGINNAGLHAVIWNGRNKEGIMVGSGIYIYKFTSGTYSAKGKVLFLR